ncbi:MAG TPA: hypothetical protein PKE32_04485 [Miltoncostaeaceae bacterium]|nr:hypothetical protein [Miltoncostaeaceae bacterium]
MESREPALPSRRRDPAWIWYGAVVVVAAVGAIAQLTGLLDLLGP